MKQDASKQVQYLRNGLEQFLANEDKHIANGTPRLRGEQYFALGALTKLSDDQIASSYYKLPTGFGKTVMFSYMAQAYLPQARANGDMKKLVILVPRLNLINQTGEKLNSFAGFTASEFSGRAKDTDADIIISTYRSLDNLVGTIGVKNIGLIFADEAHHATGDKISQTMADLIKSIPTIGFTATPSYDANKSVGNVMGTEIFAMTIADGVRSGMLSPVKNTLYCSSIVYDLENAPATSNGEYDYNSITSQIDSDTLTNEIADIYINGVDEDTGCRFFETKAMINCPNIEMAKHQAEAINRKAGCIIARAFSSEMKDFEAEKAKFIAGEYQVACQVNTMTEGFDDTTVSLCINYPTRSAVRAEQAAGRTIRLNESDPNKIAFVIDTIFKKHDGETSDTVLTTARHAKQVLFKDVAGGIVLFPKNFNDGITHDTHRPHNHGKNETIKPYEIITSTETLLHLARIDTERTKEEEIEQKTDEWLTAKELTEHFVGGEHKILRELEKLADVMPGEIEKRKSGARTALCLHRDAIEKFAQHSGLERIREIPQKTDEWLTTTELTEHFVGDKSKILSALENLADVMPGEIEKRKSGARTALCLHRDAIEKFAQHSGLERRRERRREIPQKTDEWLTTTELMEHFVSAPAKILSVLENLADEMPGEIEKRKSGTKTPLCLHRDAIEKFAQHSGLERRRERRREIPQKTDEWLTTTELTEHFVGGKSKIVNELQNLADVMPGEIEKRKSGTNTALCLHRDAIEKFAQHSGLERRREIPQKTDEWLTATELMEHFVSGKSKILSALEKLADEMPGEIEKRKSGSNTVLCLHRDAIEKFAQHSGLERRRERRREIPQKTDEWLTTTELTEHFVGNRSKILSALENLADEMPGEIEKRKSGTQTPLCLHRDAIEKFAQHSGLERIRERRREIPQKTDEWLNAIELTEHFVGDKSKILRELENLADEMPGEIEKRKSGSNTVLCLHRDAIEKFAQHSGLERRREIPQKTDEWLTATELTEHFVGDKSKILSALENLADEMPGEIEKRKSGSNTVLCLHRDAIEKFAQLSGLKIRDKVTPEKFHAGTKIVQAMTKMAEIKKQTKGTVTPDNQYE